MQTINLLFGAEARESEGENGDSNIQAGVYGGGPAFPFLLWNPFLCNWQRSRGALAGRWVALLHSVHRAAASSWLPARPVWYEAWETPEAVSSDQGNKGVPAVTVMKMMLVHCGRIHFPLDISGGCLCCSQQAQPPKEAGKQVVLSVFPIHADIPSSSMSSPSNLRGKSRMRHLCSLPYQVPSAVHLLTSINLAERTSQGNWPLTEPDTSPFNFMENTLQMDFTKILVEVELNNEAGKDGGL